LEGDVYTRYIYRAKNAGDGERQEIQEKGSEEEPEVQYIRLLLVPIPISSDKTYFM